MAGTEPEPAPEPELPLRRTGLCALLAATARRHPERIALLDAADKPAWSGRPAMTWTYAAAAEVVSRLACGLRDWRLAPGSRIGLHLPGSTEGLVAHLAVEAAGHVPCPLPLTWDEAQLAAGIEAAGIAAVLTQARLGEVRPAERLCRVAVSTFRLRFIAAFGPDVPDGVINLDAMALDRRGGAPASDTGGGLVSFAGGDPGRPMHRPGDALLAAVAVHLIAARIGPGERLLSLVPPASLPGLVTGLGAALVAGASLETLPVFEASAFAAALARPGTAHLVAPAFLEGSLAAASHPGAPGLPEGLRTVSLVHRAPARLTERTLRAPLPGGPPRPLPVDVLALGEAAVLSAARGATDLALVLASPETAPLPPGLMQLRREADGCLALRGQACKAAPLQRNESAPDPAAWQPTRFRPTLFAGTASGIAEA
ncbi:AMP-binding protein [Methylobacterium sp. A54F]